MQFDEHKRNRADLDGYFVRNAIPTEANFSDLIASGLNQRDDGIAKPADGPISLQGVDERGFRRVLNLYQDFSDDMPHWTLSVQGAGTGGLGIGRGSDDSIRLFVDDATGNVGVNTVTPQATLDVNGDVHLTGAIQSDVGPGGGISFANGPGAQPRGWLRLVNGPIGGQLTLATDSNIREDIALLPSGGVGIGLDAPDPRFKLDVSGAISTQSSELYFNGTDHEHYGVGNADGHAAIENDGVDYHALMILGRSIGSLTDPNFFRRINMYDQVNISSKLTVAGAVVSGSDARLKEDVEDSPYGLDAVNRLRPVRYNWRDRHNPQPSIGLLAQEVREVLPEVVHGDDEDGESLGIAYSSIVPVLINAVQELDRRLAALSAAGRTAGDTASA